LGGWYTPERRNEEKSAKKTSSLKVRFPVLTVASTKMAIFWAVAPCSLAEVYYCFRNAPSSGQGSNAPMMEAASSSNTSGNFYQMTECNNPDDSQLLVISS
jgi:hypothetical protein